MTERRYGEKEIAAIFRRAARSQSTAPQQLPPGEGMTLAELQEIGRDVGIAPELVAQAARSLDRADRSASRKFLGLPIGVGRTVDLDRRLSDEEWERLVVDLRETFDARGMVRYDGRFRQWTNGNLQALLEPTPAGQRFRLRTFKASAREFMTGGVAVVGLAAVVLVVSAVAGQIGDDWPMVALMSLVGAGMFGFGALRLPGWARERGRQMEGVIERLVQATGSEPSTDPPAEES